MTSDKRLIDERFPRSSKYHPEWIITSASGGANALWLTEWLTTALDLYPNIRVLDLGCGRASSSIFLRREFGVQVWATDLWFSASENLQRIRDAGVEDGVFPIHADARSLPFATEFFDVTVCIDSFPYFGTDDLYLSYLARFVKPGGSIATAGAGLTREIEGSLPDGSVSKVDLQVSHQHPKLIAVDKEANDEIMHPHRLGEADGLACQSLNPCT